jgi:hypothetical protein
MDIHGKQNIVGTIWYGLGSKRGFNVLYNDKRVSMLLSMVLASARHAGL